MKSSWPGWKTVDGSPLGELLGVAFSFQFFGVAKRSIGNAGDQGVSRIVGNWFGRNAKTEIENCGYQDYGSGFPWLLEFGAVQIEKLYVCDGY